jgi:hypothetical protein
MWSGTGSRLPTVAPLRTSSATLSVPAAGDGRRAGVDERWRRPIRSPVVVDRLGVRLGPRLVHWEMIHEIVLYPYQRGEMHEPVPFVGVRIRNRADLVGWPRSGLSRARLERAVARHAPSGMAVPVVDAPLVAEDLQRYVAGPFRTRGSQVLMGGIAGVMPGVAAGVLLVTLTPSMHPGLGVAAGLAICVPTGIAAWIWWHRGTTLTLIVDGLGITLDGRVVGWPRIETVLLFDLRRPDGRTVPALGVGRSRLGRAGGQELLGYVSLDGVEFDRLALEAALRTHAPNVAVLDWPPARLTRAGDIVR